jgi:hypothetical protein
MVRQLRKKMITLSPAIMLMWYIGALGLLMHIIQIIMVGVHMNINQTYFIDIDDEKFCNYFIVI